MPRTDRQLKNFIPGLEQLRVKERKFVLEYLGSLDARKAAETAGYHPRYGYQLLQRPHVKKVIQTTFSERVMSAEEALARLSEMARADIRDVLSPRPKFDLDGNPILDEEGHPEAEYVIDPEEAIRNGRSFLVKEVGETHEGFRVKLHDAQKALVTILRIHGAFEKGSTLPKEEPWKNIFEEDDGDILDILKRSN